MRVEILHTAEEREHAEHIRHLLALQIGPEEIGVSLREVEP